MSPRLPNISAKEAIQAFTRAGFIRAGQKGSHVRLERDDRTMLIIPEHGGDLKRPLLKALIKQAGFTEKQFREFL